MNLFLVIIAAGENGEVRYDYASKSGSAGWEVLEWSDEEIQRLVDGALALLSAERIEPGEYRIITSPGVSGTICHESFGHGVETDMFLKERARATHFIDKVVGSPLVNIVDDPSQAGSFGSYFFDDEGQLSGPTPTLWRAVFSAAASRTVILLPLLISRVLPTGSGRITAVTRSHAGWRVGRRAAPGHCA